MKMIPELIAAKRYGKNWGKKILAGIALYLLNLCLAVDFLIATVFGSDPRLSVSALLGIRLHRNPQHLILSRLPRKMKDHFLESASWWGMDYPLVNRSIWK